MAKNPRVDLESGHIEDSASDHDERRWRWGDFLWVLLRHRGFSVLPQNENTDTKGRCDDEQTNRKKGEFRTSEAVHEGVRASLSQDDPIDATWDYVRIGKKRFIPDLIPLLNDDNEELRIRGAAAILVLMEKGE